MSHKRLLPLIAGFCLVAGLAAAQSRPNLVLILADDLGFSDLGCYGGEIRTPHLDALAANGLRFTRFSNAARCCPTRAALLTGLYPHQAGVGHMVDEYARRLRETLNAPAYSDRLHPNAPTLAEVLRAAGYRTGMAGKWHLGYRPTEWPAARGFDRSFAVLEGAMNYYGFGLQHTGLVTNPPMALDREVFLPPRTGFFATDAFTDFAVRFIEEQAGRPEPFFLYLAYTAPHWPLHARPETIAPYRGRYRAIGWDALRAQRLARLRAAGIVDARWALAPRPDPVRPWSDVPESRRAQWDEEMAVYAAQVEEMDQGIGRVLAALRRTGRADHTVVMFLSDNGGAAEDPNRSVPGAGLGTRESYRGYGLAGAHVSSAPFRKTKKFTHEGGIATPLIVHWPAGIPRGRSGRLVHEVGHVIDLMPTCLELAGTRFPTQWNGATPLPPEGVSLTRAWRGRALRRATPLFWEHEGHRAVRDGKWKLVASHDEPWELYDMDRDGTELHNLAAAQPRRVRALAAQYDAWAARVGVKPWPEPAAHATKPAANPININQ